MALTKVPSNLDATVSTTQSASDNSTNVATTAYVTTAIANLSDSAPAALNTLNEIAAALGDDANYASTTTAAIAAKLPLAGGTMTGDLVVNAIVDADNFKINNAQGTDGQLLTSTGSGVAWEDAPAGGLPLSGGALTGNLLIGHTSSFAHADADNLAIGDGTNNSGLTIYTGSSKESSIIFGNAGTNGNLEAGIKYYHESHGTVGNRRAMTFATGGSMAERMRITSAGDLWVGKTEDGTSNAGHVFFGAGAAYHIRSGGFTNFFNRTSSDGEILRFAKDGTVVGSIGTTGGDLTIDSGSEHTGLRFEASDITPRHNGAAANNYVDLGTTGAKFKDLHLSGAVSSGSINNFKLLDLGSASMLITHTDRGTGTINSATHNTGFGYAAFNSLTEGDYNVAMGIEALEQNTTGSRNHAFGSYSLSSNVSGNYNTGCGYGTLNQNTASNNTAVGYEVMLDTNSGGNNTGIGYRALTNNTSGHSNVAVGYEAMNANQTGDSNTAIGYQALLIATGQSNTAIGYEAGKGVSTGTYNVAVGKNALAHNSGGSTGTFNIAIGYDSLRGLSSGNENVAMGRDAGRKITSGSGNVALGHEALIKNMTAGGNTMVGFQAGENVTGGSNTMIGYKAGEATEGGVYNIFIGQNTRGTHPSHSQQIAIGYNIDASPGQVAIGTSGMGKVYNEFNTDALWSQGSDVRLKNNITNSTLGLNFIKDLRPVTYTWKPSNELPTDFPMYQEENGRDIETIMTGLIAQEVKTAIDTSGVSRFGGWGEDNDGIQQIRAQAFVYPLIKAVQELSAKLDAAEARIATLEG